jgi:NAD(P)-dependent dehydrogenase (short-subunit alcohol dehydrogenase family)
MTSLRGAVVFVTGANGGLGTEFVTQALDRGAARVYATARTPRARDDERIVSLALDVTDPASIAAAVADAQDVTVLVNNAGIGGGGPLLDTPLADVRDLLETNTIAPLALAQAFAPILARNGGGAIIDVHSVLSWLAVGGAYSASKAAFWSVTNTLRLELQTQGTQVLGAHLGYTDTPMTANVTEPKGRADDVVRAVYDGLEAGEDEVLADEISRQVRMALSAPLSALYPQLS